MSENIAEQFAKQRRQLLTFTFVLAAIHGLDVDVERKIDASGLTLNVARIDWLILCLWVAWVYSLYRYWIYSRALPSEDAVAKRETFCVEEAVKLVTPGFLERVRNGKTYSTAISDVHHAQLVANNTTRLAIRGDGGAILKGLHLQSIDTNGSPTGPSVAVTLDVNSAHLRTARRRAARRLALVYPAFTTRTLPYFLATLAPIGALVGWLT